MKPEPGCIRKCNCNLVELLCIRSLYSKRSCIPNLYFVHSLTHFRAPYPATVAETTTQELDSTVTVDAAPIQRTDISGAVHCLSRQRETTHTLSFKLFQTTPYTLGTKGFAIDLTVYINTVQTFLVLPIKLSN